MKTFVILLVVAGLGAGGWFVWKKHGTRLLGVEPPPTVPTTRVVLDTLEEEVVTVGRVRAVFSTELRAEINGRIERLLKVDGAPVVKDEEILRLDQSDLLTQVREADRSIEAAQLRAERARRDEARSKELFEGGFITQKEYDDARTNRALAENDAEIQEARKANLDERLSRTVIRAPHDGTLLLRDLTEGQVITGVGAQSGGTLLGEVADLSAMMVRTQVNEIDVARIRADQPARVRLDAMRDLQLTGKVSRVATSATESTQDRTRTFAVDVLIDASDERVRPGMSAGVTLTLARAEGVPAVSISAVFTERENKYVFVREGPGFAVRPVKVGIADARRVQVTEGLAEGEEVALGRPAQFSGEVPGAGMGMGGLGGPRRGSGEGRRG